MEKIYNFLRAHKDLAFATVGSDGKPKIRVFQVMKMDEQNNILYFATAARKEVYKQLKDNPSVEMLALSGNVSVRIVGDALFDVSDDHKQDIYNSNPILQRLYDDYNKLEYFQIPIKSIDYYDLDMDPPLLEHHNCSN